MNDMKKNVKRRIMVLIIIAVVYSVVVFMLPVDKLNAFYISYIFTMLAIAGLGYIMHIAFDVREGSRSKFYGIPIARVGVYYLVTQLVISLLFIFISGYVPSWLPFIIYIILAGVAAIGFIAADTVRDEVERQEITVEKDTSYIRALQSKLASIIAQVQDDSIIQELEKIVDELRFSDPVSNAALNEVESSLTFNVEELQKAVNAGDNEYARALCQKFRKLITERNKLCKLNKSAFM